jgi:hypothetical protein
MVVSADMLFDATAFDVGLIQRFFALKGGPLACYYQMAASETTLTRGIVEVDLASSRITKFLEKPTPGRFAYCPVLHCTISHSVVL